MPEIKDIAKQPLVVWNGETVITTSQLAEVYGATTNNIKDNFLRNKDRFTEGKHYILLTGQTLKEFKNQVAESDLVAKNTSQLYLWTRRGASRHCKILGTDKAWEQFDYLEENYFDRDKNSLDISELSPELQMFKKIWDMQAKQELETKRIAAEQKQIKETVEIQGKAIQTVKETFTKGASEQETVQWVNHCINKIAESPNFLFTFGNRYAAARNESYQRLTTKAGCRLDQKVRNAIARAEEKGSTQAQKNNINKLTVIMADKRLKEIYVGVIKEMMIAYCVEASVKGVQA